MTRINLLDWRAEQREQNKIEFFFMLGVGAAFGILVSVGLMLLLDSQISAQESRNKIVEKEIAEAEDKIKEIKDLDDTRDNLKARIDVIGALQSSRSATVHLFDELVNTTPDGINLSKVEQRGSTVTITGTAESTGRVSTYMKNLDRSQWFEKPDLVVISAEESSNQIRERPFTLRVTSIARKKTEDAEAGV